MKDSFILYLEHKEVFDVLTDEEAGKLIKAIFEYIETGEVINLDKSLKIAFIPIKNCLDRNLDKWEDTKKKRSESGKIGAERRWNKSKKEEIAKMPNAIFAKNEIAKMAVNVHDNVNVHVNDNVSVINNKAVDSCADGLHVIESCADGLQDIIDFYNNNIGAITPFTVEMLANYLKELPKDLIILALEKSVEANVRTPKYIKAILNNWVKSGIKSVVDAENESVKFKKQSNETKTAYKNYEQRDIQNFDNFYAN